MKKNVVLLMIFLGLLAGGAAWAQSEPKAELSFNLGWTFSDGVTGDNFLAPNGNVYNRIDPKDSFAWGFTGEYLVTDRVGVGFRYNRQQSKLEIGGTTTTEIGNMKVDNYHGILSYDFGEESHSHPFAFVGFGGTHYGKVDFTFNGVQRSTNSTTKGSAVIGGGLKLFTSKNVGLRMEADWTPTYIKSDSEGYWCDPFWGCYVVGNAQYSNQFAMSGGVCVKF